MANIVHRAKGGYLALRQRLEGLKEKSEKMGEGLARTAETVSASGVAGFIDGYSNSLDVAGLPVNLAVGTALRVGSLFLSKKASPHFAAVADGFLGYFVGQKAREMGEEAAAKGEDITLAALRINRANGLNDDGSASDREDLFGHPGQEDAD